MHLKRLVSLYLAASVALFADTQSSNLLSSLKKEILSIEKQENKKNSDILKFDWIEPIIATFSHSKSEQYEPAKTTDTLLVSLNQPIFKSGGIYYAIKYSQTNREFLKLLTRAKEQNMIKSAIASLISLKKIDLQIKRQRYLIENAKIDILRKKELYFSGYLDSSFLDSAILNKNSLELALLDMESSKSDIAKSFKDLTQNEPSKVSLPRFEMVDLSSFLKKNIDIKSSLANTVRNRYLKKMTISNYFPTISFNASYSSSKTDNGSVIAHNNYKQYGLSISMPLFDINRGKNIELKRLALLKSKLEADDKKNEERNLFEGVIKKIQIYKKKITLAKDNKKLYSSLLEHTRELYKAGEKTIYDVDTLKNSFEAASLEAKIYDFDIQLQLLEIYAKMDGFDGDS